MQESLIHMNWDWTKMNNDGWLSVIKALVPLFLIVLLTQVLSRIIEGVYSLPHIVPHPYPDSLFPHPAPLFPRPTSFFIWHSFVPWSYLSLLCLFFPISKCLPKHWNDDRSDATNPTWLPDWKSLLLIQVQTRKPYFYIWNAILIVLNPYVLNSWLVKAKVMQDAFTSICV